MLYLDIVLNVPVNQSFSYTDTPEGKNTYAAEIGKRAEIRFGNRKTTGYIVGTHTKLPLSCPVPAEQIKPVLRILDKEPLFSRELLSLAVWISKFYLCSVGEAIAAMIPSGRRETNAGGFSFSAEIPEKEPLELSEEQQQAVKDISESKNVMQYVYGMTGSGKTEVFLQTAENLLKQGKGVIYLVPEISLTRQVTESVISRFGQTVAVLHSGLTPSQRLSEWNRIIHREARVIVGARSAVFAPVPDLGMIIIDEEHDGSYKSGTTPRYHARQVAMYRCAKLGIPLVMGSATPSVEAWYQMKTGKIVPHLLTRRLAGGSLPEITCIDLTKTNTKGGCLSQELEDQIHNTISRRKQVILFLNRRGFNHFFRCNTCGFELTCKNCSVPLTYHKSENRLRCHYCGWSMEPPHACPKCGSVDIGYSGFGTEFVEAEVKAKFPAARVVRIDTDSLTAKGELQKKLDAFKKGDYDILLGTQMVAKGLNFPKLQLVGVVLADTGLHMPDFRASERTFSLITQVAGRAGRFFPDGKVFVQSYNPSRDAIVYACSGNSESFYEKELKTRRLLNFPPFSRLVRLVFRSPSAQTAASAAEEAAGIFSASIRENSEAKDFAVQKLFSDVEILGPSECPLAKIAMNYRYQILLRAQKIRPLQMLAGHLLYDYKQIQNAYIEIDVDPVNLL